MNVAVVECGESCLYTNLHLNNSVIRLLIRDRHHVDFPISNIGYEILLRSQNVIQVGLVQLQN